MNDLNGPPRRQREQLKAKIDELEDASAGDEIRARLGALEAAVGLDVDASDAARELALEHGVDLSEIEGSGQEGRVVKGDVEAAIADD